MHHKNIKTIVRKQLKKQFPQWRGLPRKEKKKFARMVLEEVTAEYDFKQKVDTPIAELLAIETQIPTKDVLSLDEMAHLIETFDNKNLIKLSCYRRSPIYIKDEELKFVDELIIVSSIIYYHTTATAQQCETYSRPISLEPNCSKRSDIQK